MLTRVFSGTQGYCRVCGRPWGLGGTPLRALRGTVETAFRVDAQD